MITGSAASAPARTPPPGAAPVPGAATPGGRAEPAARGPAQIAAIDRITLTPAARLDLLMQTAGARLRDMDALLLSTSGSAATDGCDPARLMHAARGVATAVETASDANANMAGQALPGQAERIVALVAHACSSLQSVAVRLMQTQLTSGSAFAGDRVAPFHDMDRASMAETTRRTGDVGSAPKGRIAADLPDAPTIAAALATVQEIAARLARLHATSPGSGASPASILLRPREKAAPVGNGAVRRPVLPGLVCVLVALVLLQRIDPGPVQHVATMLAPPMVLAWCGHWLLRRRQSVLRDASMSIAAAPRNLMSALRARQETVPSLDRERSAGSGGVAD